MIRTLLIATFALATIGCSATNLNRDSDDFIARAYIETDTATVWRHMVEPESLTQWFSAPCREFGPQVGDPIHFADDERSYYAGKIVALEEGRKLDYTFAFVDFGFDEDTLVEVDLFERGSTVLVEIRHDCTHAPETANIITPVGWTKSLSRLKTLLESGAAMEWPVEPEA